MDGLGWERSRIINESGWLARSWRIEERICGCFLTTLVWMRRLWLQLFGCFSHFFQLNYAASRNDWNMLFGRCFYLHGQFCEEGLTETSFIWLDFICGLLLLEGKGGLFISERVRDLVGVGVRASGHFLWNVVGQQRVLVLVIQTGGGEDVGSRHCVSNFVAWRHEIWKLTACVQQVFLVDFNDTVPTWVVVFLRRATVRFDWRHVAYHLLQIWVTPTLHLLTLLFRE